MSLINIIKSRFKKETGEEWVKLRREACRTCEYNSLNSPHRTLKSKIYKHLSNFLTWLTRSENEDLGECKCLCPIYYKTKEESEECWAKENR